MPLRHLPALGSRAFAAFTARLDRRRALRLPLLRWGVLVAGGRRTAIPRFRATASITAFPGASDTVGAVGRRADVLA